jgi:hypothetical protein
VLKILLDTVLLTDISTVVTRCLTWHPLILSSKVLNFVWPHPIECWSDCSYTRKLPSVNQKVEDWQEELNQGRLLFRRRSWHMTA